MNSIFECFIEICGQKCELVFNCHSIYVTFIDIYSKIQQIVRQNLKQEIYFSTHEFEIFDDLSTEGVIIKDLTQTVRNQSILRIKQKAVIESSSALNSTLSDLNPRTKSVDPTTDTTVSLQTNPQTNPLNVNPIESVNESTIESSHTKPEVCLSIQTSESNDSTRPLKNPLNVRSLKQFENDMKRRGSVAIGSNKEETFEPDLDKSVKTLIRCEKHIQRFHAMVSLINIGSNFNGIEGHKSWKKLSDKMRDTYKQYFYVMPQMCQGAFTNWTQFYAQNYETVNGKVEPMVHKIFDLLKIVHILDLNQILSPTDSTAIKIREISLKEDLIEYYNQYLIDLRLEKTQTKEEEHHKNEGTALNSSAESVTKKRRLLKELTLI